MNRVLNGAVLLALAGVTASCGPTIRRSGQIELFTIEASESDPKRGDLVRPRRTFTDPEISFDQARIGPDARVDPQIGDLVRFTTDSVTITVPGIYLDHLPSTLSSVTTSRYDAMLFAEVWENAAVDRSQPSLNRIVHIAMDQRVPSRLNFQDAIAYGPTTFKGHPIRIKFTLILLQRRAKESADTAAKSLQDFISLAGAATPVGTTASTVVALIRQVMRSLPDVEAFDFEATLMPFQPPAAADWDAMRADRKLSDALEALVQNPTDVGAANRLGANVRETLKSLKAAQAEAVRAPAKRAVEAAKTATSKESARDGAVRNLNLLPIRRLPTASQTSIREKMAVLEAIPANSSTETAVQAAEDVLKSVDAALDAVERIEFVAAIQAAEALAAAKDESAVALAAQALRAVPDFVLISGRSVEIMKALNARPWFRYSTYALVETARFPSASGQPIGYEVDSGRFENERLQFKESVIDGTAPNWMLMDVLPGLQPVDDQILQVTSEAANRLLVNSRVTTTRRLMEDPGVLARDFDSIRDGALAAVVAARGERLAMRLAREAEERGQARASVFTEDGTFVRRFNAEIAQMNPGGELTKQLPAIRDRIREQFAARFGR